MAKLEKPKQGYFKEEKVHRIYNVSPTGIMLRKGEEMGYFEMGSTVVMMFEVPDEIELNVAEG